MKSILDMEEMQEEAPSTMFFGFFFPPQKETVLYKGRLVRREEMERVSSRASLCICFFLRCLNI